MTLRLLSILWYAKGQINTLMCYPPARDPDADFGYLVHTHIIFSSLQNI